MLGKDVPSLDPIQILNLFKKSYQKIQPDDLNKEWEYFNKPEKPKFAITLPEFKKGRSELYSKSFFKELDKLVKSKKENIRFFSNLFKEHLYVIFEDPPKFDESDQLVDVCLTLIQTFCILADTPSTEISELNKFYENAQIFIYIFALKCDCSEAQRIKDEKLAKEYNVKQYSLSQKNVLSPKKTSISTRDSKLAQRSNSLYNSKPQADNATISKNLSASTSSTIKNQTKSESMNSKTSESTNSKVQITTGNSKPQIPSASTGSKPSSTSTKPKSPVVSSNIKAQETQASTSNNPASTASKTQSSASSNSKMSSVSIDPKDSSKSAQIDSKTQSSAMKSANSYSKISSVSIDPKDSLKSAQAGSESQSSAKSTATSVSKDPKTQTSAKNSSKPPSTDSKPQTSSTKPTNSNSNLNSTCKSATTINTSSTNSSKPPSTDSKTQSSSTKPTNSNSNLNSTHKSTTINNTSSTNSKLQSHSSSLKLPSSRPDSRSSLSRTGSIANSSGSQPSQSISKLSPIVAENLKSEISCIIDLVRSNPKYQKNWDTIQSEFKSMSDKVHKYIKCTELENYCKKFNSNVTMIHTKERLEILVSCLKGIDSLIHS